jgi:hypothetical protein
MRHNALTRLRKVLSPTAAMVGDTRGAREFVIGRDEFSCLLIPEF